MAALRCRGWTVRAKSVRGGVGDNGLREIGDETPDISEFVAADSDGCYVAGDGSGAGRFCSGTRAANCATRIRATASCASACCGRERADAGTIAADGARE